jgi:hypothetical protein
LRFWVQEVEHRRGKANTTVSTLLEILDDNCSANNATKRSRGVSTLLEILAARQSSGVEDEGAEPVSTLLEILGLVWLVVVGF